MYDIFLAGPWEKYASEQYKTLVRAAFPTLRFYDPEETQMPHWFDRNLEALRHTKILFVFVPTFPFPGVGPEVGIYFERRTLMGRKPYIVAVWPNDVQPQWGKEVLSRMGVIVPTVAEAIEIIRRLVESSHDTTGYIDRNGLHWRGGPPT